MSDYNSFHESGSQSSKTAKVPCLCSENAQQCQQHMLQIHDALTIVSMGRICASAACCCKTGQQRGYTYHHLCCCITLLRSPHQRFRNSAAMVFSAMPLLLKSGVPNTAASKSAGTSYLSSAASASAAADCLLEAFFAGLSPACTTRHAYVSATSSNKDLRHASLHQVRSH